MPNFKSTNIYGELLVSESIEVGDGLRIANGDVLEVDETTFKYNNKKVLIEGDITNATSSKDGLMAKTDKAKLDGIANNANNYVHPDKHDASVINETSLKKFVSDAQITAWNAKAEGVHNHDDLYYTKTEVNNKDYLKDKGNITAVTGSARLGTTGISMVRAYNNGYPTSYGNVLRMGGTGDSEFFVGWSGSSSSTEGKHADSYIRSKRDTTGTLWSPWAKIFTDANLLKVTTTTDGLMSKEDKSKLDGVAVNANNYVHPDKHDVSIITETTLKKFVSDVQITAWNAKAETTVVTTNANGLMSKTDKSKLDGIANNANNYTHPSSHDASMITESDAKKFVSKTQIATWDAKASTTIATTSANGLMSSADKSKLDGVETGANKYIHPNSHDASIITESASKKFVSQAQIDNWNGKANGSHNHDSSYYTKAQVDTFIGDHGVHLPTLESANNAKFLRNDNTWQLVTPSNIGAYSKSEIDSKINAIQTDTGISTVRSIMSKDTRSVNDVPSSFPKGLRADFKACTSLDLTGTGGTYAGVLTFRPYGSGTDWSGGGVSQIAFPSASDKGLKVRYTSTSASWTGSWRTIWDSGNFDPENYYLKTAIDTLLASKAPTSHGNHVPTTESANNAKFLRNDNTWQLVTPGNIGAYTKGEVDTALNGKANTSHGSHIPTPEVVNNAKFLRNDNTWQLVTPSNIGAVNKAGDTMTGTLNVGTISQVGRINFLAHSNDTASIGTTVDGVMTHLDFNLSDDCAQDKFRWMFNGSGDTAVNKALMTLYKTANGENKTRMDIYGDIYALDGTKKVFHTGNFDPATKLDKGSYTGTAADLKTLIDGKANSSHGTHLPALESANNAKFLRNDNTWQLVTPGNIGAYTKSEVDTALNGKLEKWSKSGLANSYRKIALGVVSITDGLSSFVGDISFFRNNGLFQNTKISVNLMKRYNAENMWCSYLTQGKIPRILQPCTFTYGGKKYGGFNIFIDDANINELFLEGIMRNTSIVCIEYFDTQNNVSINDEINNSISTSNVSLINDIQFNGNTVYHGGNLDIGVFNGYTKAEVDNLLTGKANTSHGNHVPTTESANNAKFLRNDNTWQLVTPGNIGAYTKGEVDTALNGKVSSMNLESQSTSNANSNQGSGFNAKYLNQSATGKPSGTDHALLTMAYSSAWYYQMAGDWRTDDLYVRGSEGNGGSPRSWKKLWHSGNFDPGSKANASHGNHVPAVEGANNTRFLRNDNTWQAVTPGNIGAYTKGEIDGHWANGFKDQWYQGYSASMSGDVNAVFKNKKTGFFCGSGMSNQLPWGSHSWKHYYVASHANSAGYTGIIGMDFDGGEMGFKSISNGADKGWKRIWHHGNFDPNSKLDAGAPHTGGTFKSTYQGGSFAYAGQHTWEAPYYHTFDNGGSSDYHPIFKQRYHMPGVYYGRWSMGTLCGGNADTNFVLHHIQEGGADQQFYNFSRSGTFSCPRVVNAVWNDYAELYPKPLNYNTEPGDIIALNIDSDKEEYVKATELTSKMVVGCHSDEYGHLMGGERPPMDSPIQDVYEYNKHKYIPVGLAGRVRAKCIGEIRKGDDLVISEIPGVARAFDPTKDNIRMIFGMAVEDKEFPDAISRVKMHIKG